MTVERLFEPISEAIKEGITLELLCSYLQQNGIQITPSYLKNALYRIRKKKKELASSVDEKTVITSQNTIVDEQDRQNAESLKNESTLNDDDDFLKKIEAFNQAKGPQERWLALGGSQSELDSTPPSSHHRMAMNLKSELVQKYRLKHPDYQ